MAAVPAGPIAVGTRGTVGSLIRKEIEYFSRVEFSNGKRSEHRPGARSLEMDSNSSHAKGQYSRPGFWFFSLGWRRKKMRLERGFRSSSCRASDAADIDRSSSIRGFNYVILEGDEFSHCISRKLH